MAVSIGSNISSLKVQRQLAQAGQSLAQNYLRLSSGSRINQASDDAAGLAVASALRATVRVYGQGLRNINDAQSLLAISEGALSQLSTVTIRLRELAQQAANGSYSFTQRSALNGEASQLIKEFNRVIGSTAFNGLSLLNRSFSSLRIQTDFGTAGGLDLNLNEQLARTAGTGNFSIGTGATAGTFQAAVADINGDGILDMVRAAGAAVEVQYGNPDGSFSGGASYNISLFGTTREVALGDMNGDGRIDIVTKAHSGQAVLLKNNGDGTFGQSALAIGSASDIKMADINGDGRSDAIFAIGSEIRTFLGTASGTFTGPYTTNIAGAASGALAVSDFTGDGVLDIAFADTAGSNTLILSGNKSGQFTLLQTLKVGNNPAAITSGDFDLDGDIDFAVSNQGDNEVRLFLNQGTGSFIGGAILNSINAGSDLVSADINSDGVLDLINAAGSQIDVLLGNGDGTFRSPLSTAIASGNGTQALAGDFNGDGVSDLFITEVGSTSYSVLTGVTEQVTTIQHISLLSRQDALDALTTIQSILNRIIREKGSIGSLQSRLQVAYHTLDSRMENYTAADSRIRDIDVASESAQLTRGQILQNIGSAVLAQANQAPLIALDLLRGA